MRSSLFSLLTLAGTLVAAEPPLTSTSPQVAPTTTATTTTPSGGASDKSLLPDTKLPTDGIVPSPAVPGDLKSSTSEGASDKLFDVKSDSLDLESGTMQWKGKTFNLGDSRMMRARFDRYLAAPPPEKGYEEYIKLLDDITEKLSAENSSSDSDKLRTQKIQDAWNLLFKASKSEFDGNASLQLANQVMKAWRQRNELKDLKISEMEQKELLRRQEAIINNRADKIAARQAGNRETTTKTSKSNETTTKTEDETGKRELVSLETNYTTAKAESLKSAAEQAAIGLKSKLDFQSTIITYLTQRRFRHCLIATAFYRQIYKATHQEVTVGAQQMKELFPLSDFTPSLESVDAIAHEAINDVALGLKTFSKLETIGNRFAAFERLQETYFLGEYEPEVIRLAYETKQSFTDLTRDVRDLQKFGDERDLDSAEETLGRICAMAKDFPAARIRSKIKIAKKASDMEVSVAKQAALIHGKNGEEKIAAHIASATKIWPLNPKISTFMDEMTSRADVVSQAVPEFDKLYEAKRFRELFDKKEQFAVALLQDKPRLAKLNEVIEKTGKVEMLLAQANALATQGNRTLAWDALIEAEKADATDAKVGATRALLAPQVADYVKLLADASRAEGEAKYGQALAAYLAAKELNKASQFCQDALNRVSKAALESAPAL